MEVICGMDVLRFVLFGVLKEEKLHEGAARGHVVEHFPRLNLGSN